MYGGSYFGQSYYGQGLLELAIGLPTWVSPLNHATGVNQTTAFVFTIPQATTNLHFEIQIDTASTFDSGNLITAKSWQSQTGWEYYNGAAWVPIASTGVSTSYIGNQARFTPSTALNATTWYRRIRGRIRVG